MAEEAKGAEVAEDRKEVEDREEAEEAKEGKEAEEAEAVINARGPEGSWRRRRGLGFLSGR